MEKPLILYQCCLGVNLLSYQWILIGVMEIGHSIMFICFFQPSLDVFDLQRKFFNGLDLLINIVYINIYIHPHIYP